jgi:glutamyl-Q tRNA(Asp) synthetase
LQNADYITRFAPSPTGPLHLGHAFSALTAWDRTRANNGTMLLRIEDIDQSRARAKWEAAIFDDLAWLGLSWPKPVIRQSRRQAAYDDALRTLWDRGLLYPCTCTRRDIAQALSAPQEGAPSHGPDGLIYPGTCRSKPRPANPATDLALRLDMSLAVQTLAQDLFFQESGDQHGARQINVDPAELIEAIGDVVLARRNMGTSYHLSVVVDDAAQSVTEVVRGADLFEATAIHVLLQALLQYPTPTYYHHGLIRDADGKRLAKRDDAQALAIYRAQGASPEDIRNLTGL